MTQHELLLDMFRSNGGSLTLSQILKTQLAAEYRRVICEIKRMPGYTITLEQNYKEPGKNLYRLIESDASGQLRFA